MSSRSRPRPPGPPRAPRGRGRTTLRSRWTSENSAGVGLARVGVEAAERDDRAHQVVDRVLQDRPVAAAGRAAPHVLAEPVPGEARHAIQRRALLPPFGRQPGQDVELDLAELGALDRGDRAHEVDALQPTAVRLTRDLPAGEEREPLLEHPDAADRQAHARTVGGRADAIAPAPSGRREPGYPVAREAGYPVASVGTRSARAWVPGRRRSSVRARDDPAAMLPPTHSDLSDRCDDQEVIAAA